MKHTYISPSILVVKLATGKAFLEGSYRITNDVSSTDAWVKENSSTSSTITDKNLWDEEW